MKCLLAIALLASPALFASPGANPELFAPAQMTEVHLNGLSVLLGKPVEVTSVLPWKVAWRPPEHQIMGATRPAGSYLSPAGTHLVPFLARFPEGNLIATYALDPDTQENPVYTTGFQISTDGGAHWGRRYTTIMQHQELIFIPKAPDTLLGVPPEMTSRTIGDDRNFVGPAYLFEQGGKRMVFEPEAVRIVDWPWPVEVVQTHQQPQSNWHAELHITGNFVRIGNRILATAYGEKKGDLLPGGKKPVRRNFLVSSDNGGYTWRYYSQIAQSDPRHTNDHAYEGADETNVVQLADGDLMAVFRVGSGHLWHLNREYSHDQGRTWSQPDELPAFSVWPQLLRAADGTILLATGRPGIGLWVSTDGRGKNWQDIDIVAYHNSQETDPTYRINSFPVAKNTPWLTESTRWQTTAYNAMVEVAPNKVLLLYDRSTERDPLSSEDKSRVFVLPVELKQ